MLETAQSTLQKLNRTLGDASGNTKVSLLKRLTWPFKREEVVMYTRNLERIKTYFIMATTTDNQKVCTHILFEVQNLKKQMHAQERSNDHSHVRKTMPNWLSSSDVLRSHRNALSSRQEGTGIWFLASHCDPWLEGREIKGNERLLWLRGKPGSGKTVLISSCIEQARRRIEQSLGGALAYFYCSVNDPSSQDPANIVGCFVRQICESRPDLWQYVEPLYMHASRESASAPKKLQLRQLEHLLVMLCGLIKDKVFLFLDAPNESDSSGTILDVVCKILADCRHTVRLMVACTEDCVLPSTVIQPEEGRIVNMVPSQIQEDIRAYVRALLDTNERLSVLPKQLKNVIESELLNNADGSWVFLRLNETSRAYS